MSKFLDLIQKAKIALLSSEFLEKNAEEQFKKIDHLNSLPWDANTEKEIHITMKKIKNIVVKCEMEYKNLKEVESEVRQHIKKKQ